MKMGAFEEQNTGLFVCLCHTSDGPRQRYVFVLVCAYVHCIRAERRHSVTDLLWTSSFRFYQ